MIPNQSTSAKSNQEFKFPSQVIQLKAHQIKLYDTLYMVHDGTGSPATVLNSGIN